MFFSIAEHPGTRNRAESRKEKGILLLRIRGGRVRIPRNEGPDLSKILIVDDNRDERRMIELIIQQYSNHETVFAENGVQAVEAAPGTDLILMDVMMPGEDGVAVFQRLRRDRKTASIPVVFMSAYPDSLKERLSPEHAEKIECLSKPINPDKLVTRINQALDQTRAHSQLLAQNFSATEQLTILLTAIEQTGDGITLTDKDRNWLFINQAEVEMFGYTLEEFQKLDAGDIYTPESYRKLMEEAIPRISREGHWEGELTATRKEGLRFPVLVSLSLLTDNSGKFLGIIGITKDISVLKNAYAELQEAQEALVRSERLNALGEMVEGIAHEFNNILANILGNTQLLLQSEREPSIQKRLRSIERAAMAGAESVKSLQTFTLGHPENISQEIDLSDLLRDVLNRTRPRWRDIAQKKGLTITMTPELQPSIVIHGNLEELRTAFSHIVFNAIDALSHGGNIGVQTWRDGQKAYARITDNGCGMPPQVLERVFEPFFTTERPLKTGMGMSETYGIIKKHCGNISIKSEVGRGTTVTVVLPVFSPEAETARAGDGPTTRRQAPGRPREGRILLIDDDESVLGILEETLTRAGYRIVSRTDPKQGLEDVKAGSFDLVVTDLGMTGMNGISLAKMVREISPETKVALITGWIDNLDDEDPDLKTLDAVWGKPFDIKHLLAECDKLIER